MRFKLHFDKVSSTLPINEENATLPTNITVAQGDTKNTKLQNAIDILKYNKHVNAVVIVEPIRSTTADSLDCLRNISPERKVSIKHKTEHKDTLSSIFQRVSDYVVARMREQPIKTKPSFCSNFKIANFWSTSLAEIKQLGQIEITKSVLSYVPQYTNKITDNSFINTHIDYAINTMDFRLVECAQGSGTVLFADKDFDVILDKEGTPLELNLKKSKITCWELTTGSSVIMRGPSPNEKPCVHAHGIGGQNQPEQRLTLRYDIALP